MRVTNKDLEVLVLRLNKETGSPVETYSKQGVHYQAQVGNYHISGAYGGVSLHRICSLGGGVDDVFGCGHITKRDLYNRIDAMLQGIRSQQESKS